MFSARTVRGPQDPALPGPGPVPGARATHDTSEDWKNPRIARNAFLWPALLVVLGLAVFPLIASFALALSTFRLARGGFDLQFVGLLNFTNLFSGAETVHYLGLFGPLTPFGWVVFLGGSFVTIALFVTALRSPERSLVGLIGRAVFGLLVIAWLWLVAGTIFGEGGRPGTLTVTFLYAFVGTGLQYLIGLGLAMLTVQKLAGERFFRLVFLLPLTITPVGIAYMFRMLTDTQRGPFAPGFVAAGLTDFTLLGDPWGARLAVIIGDVWQWIPFMYIVLLAALEGRDTETEEAGLVDGAGRWQIFRYITLPMIIPVSATVILIRLIEAFKIIDLPNILTNGGPGTATESVTLQSFLTWRAFNLGSSAAIAYTLLIVVVIVATAYARLVLPRSHRAAT